MSRSLGLRLRSCGIGGFGGRLKIAGKFCGPVRGVFRCAGLKAKKVGNGGGGKRRGRKNRLLVAFHHLKPGCDILSVVVAGCVGDLKLGAQISGAKLGTEFFETIRLIAKAFAVFAVEAMRRAGPVG